MKDTGLFGKLVACVVFFFLMLSITGCGLFRSDNGDPVFVVPEGFQQISSSVSLPQGFSVKSYTGTGSLQQALSAFTAALSDYGWTLESSALENWDASYGVGEQDAVGMLSSFFIKGQTALLLQVYGGETVSVNMIEGASTASLQETTAGNGNGENGDDENGDDVAHDPGYDPDADLPQYIIDQIQNLPAAPSPLLTLELPGRGYDVIVSPNGQLVFVYVEKWPDHGEDGLVESFWQFYNVSTQSYGPEDSMTGLVEALWSPDGSKMVVYDYVGEEEYYLVDPVANTKTLLDIPSGYYVVHWFNSDKLILTQQPYSASETFTFDINTGDVATMLATAHRVKHTPHTELLLQQKATVLQLRAGYTGTNLPPGSRVLSSTSEGYLYWERDADDNLWLGFQPYMEDDIKIPRDFTINFGDFDHLVFLPGEYAFCAVRYNDFTYYGIMTSDFQVTLLGIFSGGPGKAPCRLNFTHDYLVVEQSLTEVDIYRIDNP